MNSIEHLISEIYQVEAVPQVQKGVTLGVNRKRKDSQYDPRTNLELLAGRVHHIAFLTIQTLATNLASVDQAVNLMATWMRQKEVVRMLGAGRALLAGSMPGNRLSHAGAKVSFMGGMVPLPNSCEGGGIIASSASGRTQPVLHAMEVAKQLNPKIKTIGIASRDASQFQSLCDVFIGIEARPSNYSNPLSALADVEEYVISEILDGLVVLAGKQIGFDDVAWRKGHEDIGPTGPYSVQDKTAHHPGL